MSSRRYWLPDASSKSCTNCDLPFTLFRRRHHCRICGKIFCSACSAHQVTTSEGDVRACDDCRLFAPSLLAPGNEQGVTPDLTGVSQQATDVATPVGAPTVDTGAQLTILTAQPLSPLDFVQREKPQSPLFSSPFNGEAEGVFQRLCKAADLHLNWAVHQAVLQTFSGSPALQDSSQQALRLQNWTNAILKLARRCAASVDPNVRAGDRSDVRVYIKVKAIPLLAASTANDCRVGTCDIINGAMFQRSLPHKGMRHDITNPRVMLLNGMFQTVLQLHPVFTCTRLRISVQTQFLMRED
jgi:hypothetical protein